MAPQIGADEKDVMREQLEYLMDRTGHPGCCECTECRRYRRVRALLLEIFDAPERGQAIEMPSALVKAA